MGVRWSCISALDSLTLHLVEDMTSRVVTDIGNRLHPGRRINGCETQLVVNAGS